MDLSTKYLGLDLKHPIVASASPLSRNLDGIRRLEDAGASAIVLFSLFEEQIQFENEAYEHFMAAAQDSFPEAVNYFPQISEFEVGPEGYLDLIEKGKKAVGVPLIASLNGITKAGWTQYARRMADAGADAIELNVFYIPADISLSGREVEDKYLEVVSRVRGAVKIPISVKLSPYFSSVAEMSAKLVEAGADGLVLFNRFYQPDFDLEKMEVVSNLELSGPLEMRLPLMWIGMLHGRLDCSLAATTGVETYEQVVKYVLAGADCAMTTSALLRHGPEHIGKLVKGLKEWMDKHGYASVKQMKGAMSQWKVAEPLMYERANYLKVLQSFKSTYAG